jgi:hypothetical protein
VRQDCPSENAEEEEEPKSRSNCLATWSSPTRWQYTLLRQDCPSENAEEVEEEEEEEEKEEEEEGTKH